MKFRGVHFILAACIGAMAFSFANCFLVYQIPSLFQFEASFVDVHWPFLICLSLWCVTTFALTWSIENLALVALLLIAVSKHYHSNNDWSVTNIIILLIGVLLSKTVALVLNQGVQLKRRRTSLYLHFLLGTFACLAFLSTWNWTIINNSHSFQRLQGIWSNPNSYGSLMGSGVVSSIGILLCIRNRRELSTMTQSMSLLFIIAILLLGLLFSFSRGAWLGVACGLTFLAWCHGKVRWQHVLLSMAVIALALSCLWGRTPKSAPWYIKRVDMGRFSVQNRLSAWRAGIEIMRDYPMGVGWDNAVRIYEESYHPPEGGPGALVTNDYFMIGTELGIPALISLVAYLTLCYRDRPRPIQMNVICVKTPMQLSFASTLQELDALRAACLSGAMVLIIAFWFDGGLFKQPTSALFWVLLELGANGPCRMRVVS